MPTGMIINCGMGTTVNKSNGEITKEEKGTGHRTCKLSIVKISQAKTTTGQN